MKALLSITCIALLITGLVSCSKKKDPVAKPQGSFVKTITRTFPVSTSGRSATFVYDEKNRIKQFEFTIFGLSFLNTYTYNDLDLITLANQKRTQISTGNVTEMVLEFKYAAGILNEYIENGTSYPVVYVSAARSYKYSNNTFTLDAAGNLKKIDFGVRNNVTVNYLSDKGVFDKQPAQMAFHIFTDNIRRSIDTYTASIDTYAFGKNEIANIKDDNTTVYHFSSIRDDKGNILQTDIKDDAGALVFRYMYTYELRDLE